MVKPGTLPTVHQSDAILTTRTTTRRHILQTATITIFSMWLVHAGAGGGAWAKGMPTVSAAIPDATSSHLAHRRHTHCDDGADAFTRIELFFGLSRPGGLITEEDFKTFVDARVTPRFPDGLTLISASGQFRNASGMIISEGAKLLILLVPQRDAQADEKVETIRSDYRNQFQQESVLRADAATCVSF